MTAADPTRKQAGCEPQASSVVVPHRPKWYQRIAAYLIYAAVRSVAATIRFEWRDQAGLFQNDPTRAVVFCVWHNRLALCMPVYHHYLGKLGRPSRMAAMVSASKDGGMLARVLEHYQVQPVRGSTSRRGRQALLELTTWADRGYDLGITPDGPRGPRYQVQDGVTSVAQLTGLPIVPITYYLRWKLQLRSWDGFQIPLPFSKCIVHVGRLVRVPREASEEQRETIRRNLEEQLRAATLD